MLIDSTSIIALVMLAQVIATLTLSVALLVLYRRSGALGYVAPMVVSYLLICLLAAYRIATRQVTDPWAQGIVISAYLIGDVGLLVLLSRTWSRK